MILKEIVKSEVSSKRFVAYIISIILFIILTIFTSKPPLELAGSLSMLSAIYITGETVRKSETIKGT
jgi:hypothetical protein